MNARTCACPHCDCPVEPVARGHETSADGLVYCCEACLQRHPKGMIQCQNAGCDCGERVAREREQRP